MRKFLVLATLAAVSLTGLEAHASIRRVRPQTGVVQGPNSRVMELERRKNAALRQMLLGR